MSPFIDTTYRRVIATEAPEGNGKRERLPICLGQNLKLEGRIVFGEQSRVGEDCYD